MVLVCGDIIGNKRKLFVGHHVVWNNNLCLLRPKCSMEPVPVPVHVYIVAPDCFRAEYFKKNFFHIIFLLVKAKLSIIFTTATNWIGWIVVPDFIQPIATWETFHFMHACIKMLILFKPRIRAD